jgi:hypothetical protein
MRVFASIVGLALSGCFFPVGSPDSGVPDGGSTPVDGGFVCTPGQDQTCNDDPAVSSFEGTCKPEGTCACRDDTELNPATGRCRLVTATDAGLPDSDRTSR